MNNSQVNQGSRQPLRSHMQNDGDIEVSAIMGVDSLSTINQEDANGVTERADSLAELQEDILRDKSVAEGRLRRLNINATAANKRLFPPNFIKTTRYTIISFLPLSILNQYKRLANVYFLMLSILSTIEIIAPWSPVTMITPAMFVLGVAVLRDGIEDYFRYRSDQMSNGQTVTRVETTADGRTEMIEIPSSQIVVGDIMYIREEEDLPADLVFLGGGIVQRDGGQPECFVQTSSLDGEKNLKKKSAPKGLRLPIKTDRVTLEKQLPKFFGTVYCDLPNKFLHEFNGTLKFKREEGANAFKKLNLTEAQLLLKGSKLMNTPDGVIGVVVYTGHDTKMMQNQNKQRFKQSSVEQQMNRTVTCMFVFVLVACLILALSSFAWNQMESGGKNAYYLFHDVNLSDKGFVNAVIVFFSNLILFGTFIPVSLLVTVEVSKTIQGWYISSDIEMAQIEYESLPPNSKEKAQPINYITARVNTSSLNEELGQVRFVFSDKTGTLTQNMMEFRQCKIGNYVYGDQTSEQPDEQQLSDREPKIQVRNSTSGFHSLNKMVERKQDDDQEYQREKSLGELSHSSRRSLRSNINSKQGATYNYINMQLESLLFDGSGGRQGCRTKFTSLSGQSTLVFNTQKKMAQEFLQSLSINHDCMPNTRKPGEPDDAPLTYQGSSPDEVALLEFAQKHGYEFLEGTDEELRVAQKKRVFGNALLEGDHSLDAWKFLKELNFKLLRKMEFNSDRKRMSVIIQDEDGLFKMYTKGADSIIKARLHEDYHKEYTPEEGGDNSSRYSNSIDQLEQEVNQLAAGDLDDSLRVPRATNRGDGNDAPRMLAETNQFLLEASMQGYRTLLVGMRVLDEQEVNEFLREVQEAEDDINQRAARLDAVYDKWERDLQLLGATVLEDRLQDQVPETIHALHEADIKVWVLTGDKLETAESIGFSSRLLTNEMEIVRIRTKEDIFEQFNQEKAEQNEKAIQMGVKRAIVIEAEALSHVLKVNYGAAEGEAKYDEVTRWFLKISRSMETVICCRVSPSQKAEVVRIVKQDDPEIITLSIGDGANDVPMIMEADIGIGLFGKEGMRAVDSSDIAIAQFRFLWQLLFKWGRWNYTRMSTLINYFFYKNFSYTMLQILFSLYNGFSSQSILPDFYLALYNLFFTSAPISFYSISDSDFYPSTQRIENEQQGENNGNATSPKARVSKHKEQDNDAAELTYLEAYDQAYWREFIPKLYYPGQRNLLFNNYVFSIWIIQAFFECLFIYFFTMVFFSNGVALSKDGEPGDLWLFGMTCFNCLDFIVHWKVFFQIRKYDWPMIVLTLFFTIFLYFLYNAVTDRWVTWDTGHFTFEMLWTRPWFYCVVVFEAGVWYLIDLSIEIILQRSFADPRDLVRRQILLHDGAITESFLSKFNSGTDELKQLAIQEDTLREVELDCKRLVNTGRTKEQAIAESKLSEQQSTCMSRKFKNFVNRYKIRTKAKVDDEIPGKIAPFNSNNSNENQMVDIKEKSGITAGRPSLLETPKQNNINNRMSTSPSNTSPRSKVMIPSAVKMSRTTTTPVDEGAIMRPNLGAMDDLIEDEYLAFENQHKQIAVYDMEGSAVLATENAIISDRATPDTIQSKPGHKLKYQHSNHNLPQALHRPRLHAGRLSSMSHPLEKLNK